MSLENILLKPNSEATMLDNQERLRLDIQERLKLINLVAKLYDFTDSGVRGRRVFIQDTAGLERFIPGMDLAGPPRSVASDLVGRLERFGQLDDRPTYHSLGALLDAMLTVGELNSEDSAFVAGVIARYSLIADLDYLDRLRNQYDLTEEVIRQPPADVIPPRIKTGRTTDDPQFDTRIDDEQVLEEVINSEDNFLDIHLLYGALYCAQAVARVELPRENAQGTGFLVGPDLLLTNQHVLKGKEYLEDAVVRFDYVSDASGVVIREGRVVQILSDFYFSSPAGELDYALVRLKEKPLEELTIQSGLATKSLEELVRIGKHRGYLVLASGILPKHFRVNIIQHPDGKPMKVVLTQNYVVHSTDARVQYVADTMGGSSGSPVFNQRWEVVALHHSGSPYPPESLFESAKKTWKGRYRVNEGIPMRAILKDFDDKGITCFLPRE